MAKDYKRQHYLTNSYLKGFIDRNYEGFVVWKYRKSTGEIRPMYTKESAVGEYLYSIVDSNIQPDEHSLEHRFGKVERFYVPFSHKVMRYIEAINMGTRPASKPFIPMDRCNVIEFVIIHMIRIPAVRDWISEHVGQHHENMRARGLLRFGESRAHNIEVRAIAQTYDDLRQSARENLLSRNTAIEFSVRAKNTVFTCDNPVMQWPPDAGMVHDTTEILFPLNRRAFIRFYGRGNNLSFMKRHGSDRTEWFNKLVIELASDEVYAADPQQLLKTLDGMGRSASIIEERTRKFRKRGTV